MLFKVGITTAAAGWLLLVIFACIGFVTDLPDLPFYPMPIVFFGLAMMLASGIAIVWND